MFTLQFEIAFICCSNSSPDYGVLRFHRRFLSGPPRLFSGTCVLGFVEVGHKSDRWLPPRYLQMSYAPPVMRLRLISIVSGNLQELPHPLPIHLRRGIYKQKKTVFFYSGKELK